MSTSANIHIDTSRCHAEKNRGRMIGIGVGAAVVIGGHLLLKKQMPAYAVPGSYQLAKAVGAAGIPALLMYFMGEQYEKDCRARNAGLSPPRISTTTYKQ